MGPGGAQPRPPCPQGAPSPLPRNPPAGRKRRVRPADIFESKTLRQPEILHSPDSCGLPGELPQSRGRNHAVYVPYVLFEESRYSCTIITCFNPQSPHPPTDSAADGEGSCGLPLPEGRGYEKGFHRLRRLVNHFFPLKGEVSNHKGISDGPYIRPPGARPAQEHSRRGLAGTAIPACGIDIEYLRLLHRKSRDDILPVKIFHEKLSVFQSLFHQDDFHKFRAAGR